MGRISCYVIALIQLCLVMIIITTSSVQTCGKRKVVNFLIVNGTEAKDGHWPWHVAIFHKNWRSLVYVCGGTILDQNTVITAAHCLIKPSGIIAQERLLVQVGRSELGVATNRAQEHAAFQLILHPEYSVNSIRHDIALIKLATDISFTDFIQPICLWNRGEDQNAIVGSWGTVVGFGIDETDKTSDSLRETRIPVVSAITCIESNREVFAKKLTSNMFCAGNRDGISACNGDSGGGLFFNFDGTWFIRGLVSFTKPRDNMNKCDTKEYTAFTDVAKYLKWIQQHMRGTAAVAVDDNNPKIGLLPMSTCGSNPYEDIEELSKPVLLGYPWVGLLYCVDNESLESRPICHVTLISNRHLITAASSVYYLKECHHVSIRLGEYNRNTTTDCAQVDGQMICSPPVQILTIESVNQHKNFDRFSYTNDIALIRLRDRADTSQSNVKPICLPVTSELRNQKSTHYTLTAWSYTASNVVTNVVERSLRELIDWNVCNKMFHKHRFNLTTGKICIKHQIDPECLTPLTGAPLQLVQQVQENSRYVLYGILSHGFNACYIRLLPDVYTDVAYYMDWILENLQE